MLVERIYKQWRRRELTAPFHRVVPFKATRLVLGPETFLAPVDPLSGLSRKAEIETRLLALLSVAYRRPINAVVLQHVCRA